MIFFQSTYPQVENGNSVEYSIATWHCCKQELNRTETASLNTLLKKVLDKPKSHDLTLYELVRT